ncbi:hypothetical protein Hypma_004519 [Hypsizygus marmoreus]|uniref:F-box domain-containing protein n=1 Tax=Hypsizygus marmoreus TaxID=39966 RepID=A0A369K175_HYPMA|nr:hypothetical protein Hypma_004519 [Hypsizygus marmoreus]
MWGGTQYNAPTTDTPFGCNELVDLLPFVDADVEDFGTSKASIGGYTRETWRSLSILTMRKQRRQRAGQKMVRNISECLDLPLDLIFEIFGYLHPLDIFHISQTTKSLRNVVLVRSAQSLWKTAYKRHRDVPRCPPSMSEPAWTALIFSAMLCEECGQYRVLTDFALRTSLCDSCMDSCYMLRNPPANASPAPYPKDHVVWELLPYSCRWRVKRDSPWVTSDVDTLDPRLLCVKCPVAHYRRLNGRKVFTWRECVIHAMEMELHEDHDTHSWHLLTPDTTAIIKLHETKYPSTTDKAWSCNHCTIHVSDLVTRKATLHHVKSVHSVGLVRDKIDLLYQRGSTQDTPRRPVCLSVDPPAECRCARCPNLGFRLFIRERLGQHLLDKHGIENPVDDKDIVKVTHILKTSTPE